MTCYFDAITLEYIRREAIDVFYRVATCHEAAFKILLDIIRKSSDKYVCEQAVIILIKIGKDNDLAIKALIEVFDDYFDNLDFNIYDLAKAVLSNKDEAKYNSFYNSSLINFIKNPTDEKAAFSLYLEFLVYGDGSTIYKLPSESRPEIETLIKRIKNNQPESSDYRLAILDLGDVNEKDRKKAIATLTSLFPNSSDKYDEHIVMIAVQSLYRNDPQNKLILETVPRLIENASHPNIISNSVACLDKFDKVNDKTIEALATVIKNTDDKEDDEEIIRRAAEALGNIDPGNIIATDKLSNLIKINYKKYQKAVKLSKEDKNYRYHIDSYKSIIKSYQYNILFTAEILCGVAPENEIAHDKLIYLIKNYYDEDYYIRQRAMNALIAEINQLIAKKMLIEFKQYLLPIKYENSLRIKKDREQKSLLSRPPFDPLYDKCRKFCWHFEEYYDLILFCSKQISYREFYQTWHQQNFFLTLKVTTQVA